MSFYTIMEESFEALGIEKSSDPSLQVKEVDPELFDVIPGSRFVNKFDKYLTAIESQVLRAATPALSLLSELQAARNNQKTAVDVNKLITLAEASVCALGQAGVPERSWKIRKRQKMSFTKLQMS